MIRPPTDRSGCGGDQLVRCVGVGEVELVVVEDRGLGQHVGDAVDDRAPAFGVGSPWLIVVWLGVLVQKQAGAQRSKPACDGVSDSGTAACAGHQSHPAA